MNLPVPINAASRPSRARMMAEEFAAGGERSPHTRAGYRLDLSGCSQPLNGCRHLDPEIGHSPLAWLPWCESENIDPLGPPRHAAVLRWLAALADARQSEPTRARRLAAVSSWYRWLIREQVVAFNPADLKPDERPRPSSKVHEISPIGNLATNQSAALLAAADADKNPVAAPLTHLLAHTGARISEALGANADDIKWPSGHPVLSARGKGGKVRPLPLPPAAYDRIQAYLTARADAPDNLPALAAGATPVRPLFTTRAGRRLSRQAAHSLLRRLARDAGLGDVAGDMCAHMLRHSYATDLLAEGVPLRDVQYAMGHSDPRTTERYDHSKLDLDRHPTYRRAAQLSRGSRQPVEDLATSGR